METATKEKEYARYTFEYDGRAFISRVLVGSSIHNSIDKVGKDEFIKMNVDCLNQLMGAGLTINEIKAKLYELNKSGSKAFIELEQD
jgi:hypothetical protein